MLLPEGHNYIAVAFILFLYVLFHHDKKIITPANIIFVTCALLIRFSLDMFCSIVMKSPYELTD